MMLSSERIKHLDYIQDAIMRMNKNSFQLKEWCIGILSALLVVFIKWDVDETMLLISIVPTIMFWCLDSYYLLEERKFREVFDVAKNGKIGLFEMHLSSYSKKCCFLKVMFSKTVCTMYIGILLVIIFLTVYVGW